MIKLNNKGTTLVELIISIVLISVVIVFMFQLLIDLNNEELNNDFAINNQIIRAEIIKFINEDLANYTLSNIKDNSSNSNILNIEITYKENKKTLIEAHQDYIVITNAANKKQRWDIKDATLYPNKAFVYTTINNTSKIYSLNFNMEIHTVNDNNTTGNNNIIDDISISYIGSTTDYLPNLTCLGHDC